MNCFTFYLIFLLSVSLFFNLIGEVMNILSYEYNDLSVFSFQFLCEYDVIITVVVIGIVIVRVTKDTSSDILVIKRRFRLGRIPFYKKDIIILSY